MPHLGGGGTRWDPQLSSTVGDVITALHQRSPKVKDASTPPLAREEQQVQHHLPTAFFPGGPQVNHSVTQRSRSNRSEPVRTSLSAGSELQRIRKPPNIWMWWRDEQMWWTGHGEAAGVGGGGVEGNPADPVLKPVLKLQNGSGPLEPPQLPEHPS